MEELARCALQQLNGEGLVSVRRLFDAPAAVTIVAIVNGRAGRAEATETDDLTRAAKTASLRAQQAAHGR